MALTISELKREFYFGDRKLVDPDPSKTPEQVAQFYAPQIPELNNASVSGPVIKNDIQTFNFSKVTGTKS